MTESVDLNNLTIKTDSLPDDWKMLLIDPVTLRPAQNITVARFIELLIGKMPEVTKSSKGLMSSSVFNSMIYNNNTYVGSNETIDNASPGVSNISVDMAGSNTYGLQYGVLVSFTSIYYRAQIAFDYRLICKMRVRTETGWRSWLTLSTTQDLKSTQPNALTESFSNSYSFTPPPPANCVPNYSLSAGSIEQFANPAILDTDIPDGSTPVTNESGLEVPSDLQTFGRTEVEMKTQEFVSLLNGGTNTFILKADKNDGFPVLVNQKEGDPFDGYVRESVFNQVISELRSLIQQNNNESNLQ